MGHLKLFNEQIAAQFKLPESQCLKVTNSWKIIYPGKNHNTWWDLKQLMDQMQHAMNTCTQIKLGFGSLTAYADSSSLSYPISPSEPYALIT